jgi:hypothetical protein
LYDKIITTTRTGDGNYKGDNMDKPVVNKALLKKLGFEDYREFIVEFGNWAYSEDFTYREKIYTSSFERLLQNYIEWKLN